MTSLIAIMNKEAIALASDSAVTIEMDADSPEKARKKIFTSANKLFALSKRYPVGIMVYGNATFMGIPWETIIKIYRNSIIAQEEKHHLSDYAANFIDYLDNGNNLFVETEQKKYIIGNIYSILFFIKKEIRKRVQEIIKKNKSIDEIISKTIVTKFIDQQYLLWEKTENIPSIPQEFNQEILDKFEKEIEEAIKKTFENFPISRNQFFKLKKICGNIFSKFPKGIENRNKSGIVVTGFGSDDTFPAIQSFDIVGVANNKLKFNKVLDEQINFNNAFGIYPFAQTEMVHTFMLGVDPTYLKIEEMYLTAIFSEYSGNLLTIFQNQMSSEEKRRLKSKMLKLNKEILKEFKNYLKSYREKYNVKPVTNVVKYLPKSELALMAESLIHLTSLKRKFTDESETVADPIDVAVISKGDGFIWIKRKHYFERNLNPSYVDNYMKGA